MSNAEIVTKLEQLEAISRRNLTSIRLSLAANLLLIIAVVLRWIG